jgi:hypothetical protein
MSFNIKGISQKIFVTHAEDKGGYGQIRFYTFRKKADKFVKSFYSFWAVRSDAYDKFGELLSAIASAPSYDDSSNKKPVTVFIKDFSFSQEKYIDKKTNEEVYSKQPQFVIWNWDFEGNAKSTANLDVDESESPF